VMRELVTEILSLALLLAGALVLVVGVGAV
jgi:hypothetical protein